MVSALSHQSKARFHYLKILRDAVPDIDSLKVSIVAIVERATVNFEFVGKLRHGQHGTSLQQKAVEVLTTRFIVFPLTDFRVLADDGVAGSIRPTRTFSNKDTPSLIHRGLLEQALAFGAVFD